MVVLAWSHQSTYSQSPSDLNIQHHADIPSTCQQMTMTMKHDQTGRPYLYVAGKEGGLRIYNISNLDQPMLVKTIPITSLENLEVMNIDQSGEYLALALGNHFTNSQSPGMAIINVSDPASASVVDTWKSSAPDGGAGIVKLDGDHAYLGAMKHGVIVLDVSNKGEITFVSQYVPDINYPTPNPNPDLYNARGMVIRNDVIYLCYDAGGLRIINVSNKLKPVETGRYSNPALNGLPRAYNNIVLDDSLVYIAVDYCGLEVLNISDTSHITLTGWWNPYNCPTNNWFSSPVHANEIAYNRECRLLFIADGKSDMHVIDISDPTSPDSVGIYGGATNDLGTWGVSVYRDQIFLSYICAIIPFASSWTGVKILTYNNQCVSAAPEQPESSVALIPSLAGDRMTIRLDSGMCVVDASSVIITDLLGRSYYPVLIESTAGRMVIDPSALPAGFHILSISGGGKSVKGKFIRH